MKRSLIFVGYYDNLAFDMAKSELLKGGEVFMVGCDQSVGICHCNYGATSLICKLCSHQNKQLFRHFNGDSHFHWKMMGNLVSDDIRHLAATTSFDYDDVASLKALQYKGVDIGYAAFSTYVSVTRNLTPSFNAHLKAFLDDLMRSEIRQIEALQQYVEEISPDMMVVMCGRHSNQKPIYQLAVNNHINFVVTERKWTENGEDTYDFFVNDSPLMAAFPDQAGFIKGPDPESQEPAVIGNLCQFGLHTDFHACRRSGDMGDTDLCSDSRSACFQDRRYRSSGRVFHGCDHHRSGQDINLSASDAACQMGFCNNKIMSSLQSGMHI